MMVSEQVSTAVHHKRAVSRPSHHGPLNQESFSVTQRAILNSHNRNPSRRVQAVADLDQVEASLLPVAHPGTVSAQFQRDSRAAQDPATSVAQSRSSR